MRIYHIIPNLKKGGAERLVLDIVTELLGKNFDTQLIVFEPQNDYQEDYKHIIPFVIKKENIADYIIKNEPDIVHTHLFESEYFCRKKISTTTKYFSHFHNSMPPLGRIFYLLKNNKKALRFLMFRLILLYKYRKSKNYFICISNATFKYAITNLPGYFKKRIILLNNAINTSNFAKNNTHTKTNNTKLKLITVGRLDDNKNHIFLISVVYRLKTLGIDLSLDILGDGVNMAMLKKQIKKLDLLENIRLHGNVANPKEYYWNADIYLHAARSEGFGLTILEAIASGLPVVTLDGVGNRDLIEQGKNGFIIYQEDPELFADTILEIWKNKQSKELFSKNAKSYSQQFDIKNYTDKLVGLYRNALYI